MSVRIPVARPELGEPEIQAVRKVIESGWVTQGPRVAEFEESLARHCQRDHAVAVSSCTTALHLALVCAGVGPGDEVVVPSMSFIATANAVVHAGATPVFAEVDHRTFNLDVEDVARRIGPRTRAIMLVHQLGLPADIDAFTTLADEAGVALVEDAACAIGSTYRGKPIGAHSEFVCFSFHPRKVITTGDGGAVITGSEEHDRRLRLLRQHGMNVPDTVRHQARSVIREEYVEIGYNYRLTDLQAAVGIEQLARLAEILEGRQSVAAMYEEALADAAQIVTPLVPDFAEWNVQSYAVTLDGLDAEGRDAVMQALLDEGIATRSGVMTTHREPAYASDAVSLPVSEQASDSSMILPLYVGMSESEVGEVADALTEAVASAR